MATLTLSYPMAYCHNGLLYLIGYQGGTQYIRRSGDGGKTWMRYSDNTLEKPIAASDAERVAFVKMETQGGRLIVGLPSGGEVVMYQSPDDGETWQITAS
jgi:hypothetical protein